MPTVSADGLVYTIKLRRGVTFHSGNEMTADDVVYSYRRCIPLFDGWAIELITYGQIPDAYGMAEIVDSVDKVDDYTVRVTLKQKYPFIVEHMAQQFWVIMEKAQVEGNAITTADGRSDHGAGWVYDEINEAGTGPYTIDVYIPMEVYKLKRVDNYWGGPPELDLPTPKFETINLIPVVEEADARMKLEVGELDIIWDVLPETVDVYRERAGFETYTAPTTSLMGFWMHTYSGPLWDWRVRKAVKMALDYDAFAEKIMLDTAYVCQGAYYYGAPGYEKTAHYFPGAEYEEAMALLEEAEYPVQADGWRFELDIYARPAPRFGMDFIDFALKCKDDLAKVQIKVNILVFEVGEYYELMYEPTIEGVWLVPGGIFSKTEPYFYFGTYALLMGNIYTHFNATTQPEIVPTARSMFDSILDETDADVRFEMWQEFDAYMLEKGPIITLVLNGDRYIYTDKLTGFFPGGLKWIWPAIFYMDIEE